MGATGDRVVPDPRLHHPDGTHRESARTAKGSDVEWFASAMPRHMAEHGAESPESGKVSVWTRNTSEAWMTTNTRCSDMLLVAGMDRAAAESLVKRLQLMYDDPHLEIHPYDRPPKAGTVGSAV